MKLKSPLIKNLVAEEVEADIGVLMEMVILHNFQSE